MPRRALLVLLLVLAAAPAPSQEIVKRVGLVTFRVDASRAFPGGTLVVRLVSRRGLGTAYAILDGRRAPFYMASGLPRALVPVPLTTVAGPNVVGVEIVTRRGRQRIPVSVDIAERTYPPRTSLIPEEKRPLLAGPAATHDGRQLLALLRTETTTDPRAIAPPITIVPGLGFGGAQTWIGGSPVESMIDSIWGEQHRGVDFEVPLGTVVMAPAAGTVLLAGPLTLTGPTLVLDHGQGVISALFHLSRIDVAVGDRVEARAAVGLSGDGGIAPLPLVQWRTYVHGVAVDPAVLQQVLQD